MKAIMNLVPPTIYILASLAGFTTNSQAFTLKYHVLAITPGSAQGVDDKGDVVGTFLVPTTPPPPTWYNHPFTDHAFLYKGGKVFDLGVLFNPSNPVFDSTRGEAVNNSDIVVGRLWTDSREDTSTIVVLTSNPASFRTFAVASAFCWRKSASRTCLPALIRRAIA
jgi:hypothetical protein